MFGVPKYTVNRTDALKQVNLMGRGCRYLINVVAVPDVDARISLFLSGAGVPDVGISLFLSGVAVPFVGIS
jgi:hypothetical protein